jgi:hypothetical protein
MVKPVIGSTGWGTVLNSHLDTLTARASLSVNVIDYGADPTGVVDSTTAFGNAATAAANGGEVFAPAGTYLLASGWALSGKSCSFRGVGEGTILTCLTNNPVIDFTGYVPGYNATKHRHFRDFNIIGSNTSGYTANKGIVFPTGTSLQTINLTAISISATGGVGVDFGSAELCSFRDIVCSQPIGCVTHDVPYYIGTGPCNGNRFIGIGLRSTNWGGLGEDCAPSGAVIFTDNGSYPPSFNLFQGWWFEFLHPENGCSVFKYSGNRSTFADFQFFDLSIKSGATNTSHVTFGTPSIQNYGGNTWRGIVPAQDSNADSIQAGIILAQNFNNIQGVKGYRGRNVTLNSGITGTTVFLTGSVSGASFQGIYDNSGTTGNTLNDYTTATFSPALAVAPNIQTFTTTGAGTWNKPAAVTTVRVDMIGGGSGGGSGARGAANVIRCGGGGGGSGGFTSLIVAASALASSVAVFVGAGGAGGVAAASDASAGAVGTAGTKSSFGSSPTLMAASPGGVGGAGGLGVAGAAGTAGAGTGNGSTGTASIAAGTVAGAAPSSNTVGGGGGAGGGITAAAVSSAGSNGGIGQSGFLGNGAGGATGVAGGNGVGSSIATVIMGGGGGGGGAHDTTPGKGGNGAVYGASGGGGGASLNGNASGAGGDGANGIIVVTSW